jgi:hypothetical protein
MTIESAGVSILDLAPRRLASGDITGRLFAAPWQGIILIGNQRPPQWRPRQALRDVRTAPPRPGTPPLLFG